MQDYAVRVGGDDQSAALSALRPSGKGLNEILKEQFEKAIGKAGGRTAFREVIAALAALPPPIPPPHLAAIGNITVEAVDDLVNDLMPGLAVENGAILIADEDFEDFVHDEAAADSKSTLSAVADHLNKFRLSDPYAATHVADALVAASRGPELLRLIEESDSLKSIEDPILRREVSLRRLRLALRVCRNASDTVHSLRVILLSADADKEENTLREVLERHVDLAVRFAWPTLSRLVLANSEGVHSQGSVLAQAALGAACVRDRLTARERLASHDAWLQRRRETPQERQHLWTLSDEDVAARVEAIFELAGVEAALHELERWRPPAFRGRVATGLVPALIARGRQDALQQVVQKQMLHGPWDLFLLMPLMMAGYSIDTSMIAASLSKLRTRFIPTIGHIHSTSPGGRYEERLLDLLLTACEAAIRLGVGRGVVLKALQALSRRLPPSLHHALPVAMDAAMRIWLMKAHISNDLVSVDALLNSLAPNESASLGTIPQRQGGGVHPHGEESKQAFRDTIRALFPIYAGRLELITRANASPLDEATVNRLIPGVDPTAYSFDMGAWSNELRVRAARSIVQLMALPSIPARALFTRAVCVLEEKHLDQFGTNVIPLLECLALRKTEREFVSETACTRARAVREWRTASSDKIDALLRFSRLLLRFNPDEARELFRMAIDLTKEIDQEALRQIALLEPLSVSSGKLPVQARRQMATQVHHFVSGVAERLSNDEFPWNSAVVCLSRLSVPVAFCSIARWADIGWAEVGKTLKPLLREALKSTDLSPAIATSLSILLERPDAVLMSAILEAETDATQKETLGDELARDSLLCAPPGDRLALGKEILSRMPQSGAVRSGVAGLRAMVAFLEGLPATDEGTESTKATSPSQRGGPCSKATTWPDFNGLRFNTAKAIQHAIDKATAAGPSIDERELLVAMREAVEPSDRLPFLEALTSPDLVLRWRLDRAWVILEALDAWSNSPAIDRWRIESLPHVVIGYFGEFGQCLEGGSSLLADLLKAARLSASDRFSVLIGGVEASGLALSGRALYGLVELMVPDLPAGQSALLLQWWTNRLASRVPADSRLMLDLADVPESAIAAVARFLFALLSDISVHERWRAAHAVRRLARLEVTCAIDQLVGNLFRTEEKSFRLPDAPFYWLAARLWLALTLERIAHERPQSLFPHLIIIAKAAADTSLPHVVIREYAKRAVLRLVEHEPAAARDINLDSIRSTNLPRLKKTGAKLPSGRTDWRNAREGEFKFNSIDTLPYWYSSLLRLFPKVTQNHVLKRAEHWIMHKWGAPAEANWWHDEPRPGRYHQSEWSRWEHSHGCLPMLERYGTHLEWHAMLCVAGELLESHALQKSPDYHGSFDDWLGEFMPTYDSCWLSDCRDPVPLEPRFWMPAPHGDVPWLRTARTCEFLEELGVNNSIRPGWIVVAGRHTIHFATREQQVTVESALVSPDTATSLVRALETAHEPSDFRIPAEDDSLEIEEGPYRLVGWLGEAQHELQFDQHDPLWHQAYPLRTMPGKRVSKTLSLKRSDRVGASWVGGSGKELSCAGELWSDLLEREGSPRFARANGTEGRRLWMRSADLQTFLKVKALDLIYKVQIRRHIHSEYANSYGTEAETRKQFHRIFLLRRSGGIESAEGGLGSWAVPSRSARSGTGR